MKPRVWIPAIIVFLLGLLFAGMRLHNHKGYIVKVGKPVQIASPGLPDAYFQRMGPPTDEEDKR